MHVPVDFLYICTLIYHIIVNITCSYSTLIVKVYEYYVFDNDTVFSYPFKSIIEFIKDKVERKLIFFRRVCSCQLKFFKALIRYNALKKNQTKQIKLKNTIKISAKINLII